MSIKVLESKQICDTQNILKYDKQGMHKIYDVWPQVAKESYQSTQDPIKFENVDHIIFAGMGGSGSINDVFCSILSKTKIHVSSVKSHLLPNTVDLNTLVVVTSISGNTMESLSVLDSARRMGVRIIAFSSGGKIKDYCKKHLIEHKTAKMFNSPRTSYTSFLYTMLKVLEPTIPIKKEDILESFSLLEKTQKLISSSNLNDSNESLSIAKWITKIPLIYYPQGLQAAAIRFKNSLQENAKSHVMIEECGEACHNGIVSWEVPSSVQPILLQGYDDHVKTKERWKIFRDYFDERDIEYKEIHSVKGSLLSKLVNLNYLLDYTTIYHAVLHGIDPSPIKSTEFVKSRL